MSEPLSAPPEDPSHILGQEEWEAVVDAVLSGGGDTDILYDYTDDLDDD